ncbi:hypothetical protein [Megasphaera cerevisiae]|jgi:hypothetical protein|uniref:hypothetical protein n=1 Tax=Megasphaera cerevisiae TaxID=39029 RepID=UPI000941D589|nr:hypothetical protein [Megasphaera cerevisiae]OKY52987.1 hypothetical protein BSR42_09895 [Megasphaera cerevisiae]
MSISWFFFLAMTGLCTLGSGYYFIKITLRILHGHHGRYHYFGAFAYLIECITLCVIWESFYNQNGNIIFILPVFMISLTMTLFICKKAYGIRGPKQISQMAFQSFWICLAASIGSIILYTYLFYDIIKAFVNNL